MCYNKYSGHQCVSRKKIQKGPVRGDAGKGVKKMKNNKILFGIRTELIEETKSALRKKADFEKKAEKMSAEQAEQAEERLEEILKDLAFFEAFQKQDYMLDLVFYTGIFGPNILILEPALKLPAGVSYDSTRVQLLAPEKRSEIEEKMREAEDVLLFTSKEEAIKEMTSI